MNEDGEPIMDGAAWRFEQQLDLDSAHERYEDDFYSRYDEPDADECEHDGTEYSHAGWVCSWCGVGVPDPIGWDSVNGRWAD